MNIVEFEKEVMHLFEKHYAGTEKMLEKDWFKIEITSLHKTKKIKIFILNFYDSAKTKSVCGMAEKYDELFIEMLYSLKDYLAESPYENVLCTSCHGKGEFEISAGSHSYFKKCDKCSGSGKNGGIK